MNILVINCGSSSFKYQLIDMTTEQALCSGLVERIGESMGRLVHKKFPDTANEAKHTIDEPFTDHTAGMGAVMELIVDKEWGVIENLQEISAVGHRVVQGGEKLQKACIVTDDVKKGIEEVAPLAPLHNHAHLQGIEAAQRLLAHAPSVVVFDTEFHSTMPAEAYMYPLPYELYEEFSIRRYGFHGTSHRYVGAEAAKLLGKSFENFTGITCHLGNGCSITAIKDGKCIDTSMGMTPLAGVMMGTRCGDIAPATVPFLAKHKNMAPADIDPRMNKESGLKGIAGNSDMRDLHSAVERGDKMARLALDMFCYNILKYIGSYYIVLGHADALVFTAGIGENDDIARKEICARLTAMGIKLDLDKNAVRSGEPRVISQPESKVPVMVIPTNEELAIALATAELVQ